VSETLYGLAVKNAREIAHGRTRVSEFPDIPPKDKLGALVALHQGTEVLSIARLVAVMGCWTIHATDDFQWVFADVVALENPVPITHGIGEFTILEPQTLAALRLEYGRTVRRAKVGASNLQTMLEGA
jgi:hypothetical protein